MRPTAFLARAGAVLALSLARVGWARAQDTAPRADVALDRAIEVTQAIQDPLGTVPLLAGRAAWVRVYLAALRPGLAPVRGTLRVRTAAGERDVASAGVTAPPPQPGGTDRRRVEASLNFRLEPETLLEGDARLELVEVRDAASGQPLVCADCASRAAVARFEPPTVLRVRLVGLRYDYNGTLLAPRDTDFAAVRSWLTRAFPVSELRVDTVTLDVRGIPVCESADLTLARIRALDLAAGQDPRTRYYGLVRDAGSYTRPEFMQGCTFGIPDGPDASSVASGAAGAPIRTAPDLNWEKGPSYAGWYGGHELAHTFGRRHPGWCEQPAPKCYQTMDDAEADTALHGRIGSGPEGDLGMDPLTGEVYDSAWSDLMTGRRFRWIGRGTYVSILRRLREEDALYGVSAPADTAAAAATPAATDGGAPPAAGDSILEVLARFGKLPSSNVSFHAVFTTARRGRPAAFDAAVLDTIPEELRVTIEVAFGTARVRYPAWLMMGRPRAAYAAAGQPEPATPTGEAWVHAYLPAPPGEGWVRILRGGEVVDSMWKSASAPHLDDLQHAIASRSGKTVGHLYSYRGVDPDDAWQAVTTYAQVSLDGGATWLTVQQTRGARILIPCAMLRGRASVRVRLIASDSVNQAVAFPGEELVQPQNDPCAGGG